MAKLVYLKEFTNVFTSDVQRDLVCAAINMFGTGDGPMADAGTILHFSAQCALECVDKVLDPKRSHVTSQKLLMEFHSRICDHLGDMDANIFNEVIHAAHDAFWKVVADRYRSVGITTGDVPPDAKDTFHEAACEAVGAWLLHNKVDGKKRRDQRSDARAELGVTEKPGDTELDSIEFADQWNPDRDFHTHVEAAASSHLPAGWSVSWEYPGYFAFKHEARKNFLVLATPDHEDDGTIAVDAMNDDLGHHLRGWDDIPWPIADRVFYPNGEKAPSVYRAYRFLHLLAGILAECSPRKLVVEYDVTGWTPGQIASLGCDAEAQAEASKECINSDDDEVCPGHPDAKVLRVDTVPL